MQLEGKFTLQAPIEQVWNSLLKPEMLASCIPGAEEIKAIDEKTYYSVVKQKVGPISVRFKCTTTITEIEPPTYLKAVGKGADITKLATFSQETTVNLKSVNIEETEVSYLSNVSLVGKLANFGDRLLRAKAKKVEEEFTHNLQQKLTASRTL